MFCSAIRLLVTMPTMAAAGLAARAAAAAPGTGRHPARIRSGIARPGPACAGRALARLARIHEQPPKPLAPGLVNRQAAGQDVLVDQLKHQAVAPAKLIRGPHPNAAFFHVQRRSRADGRVIMIKERVVHIEQDAAQETCHRYNQRLVYRVSSFHYRRFPVPYPEYLVAPMRQELVAVGARECRTPADVDDVMKNPGVVMMVVNSVCGCAAGKARPGIAMALQHANRPSIVATVFAGADMRGHRSRASTT